MPPPIIYPTLHQCTAAAKNHDPMARLIIAAIVMLAQATGETSSALVFEALTLKAQGKY